MLLGASGRHEEKKFNLNSVTDSDQPSGVEHGELLRELTDATVFSRWKQLQEIRKRATKVLGNQTLTDVLTVAAGFNGITRVADSTGIPLDKTTDQTTFDMRKVTGIALFDYAKKTSRYELKETSPTG